MEKIVSYSKINRWPNTIGVCFDKVYEMKKSFIVIIINRKCWVKEIDPQCINHKLNFFLKKIIEARGSGYHSSMIVARQSGVLSYYPYCTQYVCNIVVQKHHIQYIQYQTINTDQGILLCFHVQNIRIWKWLYYVKGMKKYYKFSGRYISGNFSVYKNFVSQQDVFWRFFSEWRQVNFFGFAKRRSFSIWIQSTSNLQVKFLTSLRL